MVTPRGTAYLVCGVAANALFAFVAIYGIAFIGNVAVPKTVDAGLVVPWPRAVFVDTLLILTFAVQHSVMARVSFKRWSMRIVPAPIEPAAPMSFARRYLLVLLYWLWLPIPAPVWTVQQPLLRAGIIALFWAGWIVTLLAAAATNQLEMTELRNSRCRPGPASKSSDADDFGPLPDRPASDLRRHPRRLLGDAGHDVWSPPVCRWGDRLHSARNRFGGARSGQDLRRRISRLSAPNPDAASLPEMRGTP